jgi:hypothetical protein
VEFVLNVLSAFFLVSAVIIIFSIASSDLIYASPLNFVSPDLSAETVIQRPVVTVVISIVVVVISIVAVVISIVSVTVTFWFIMSNISNIDVRCDISDVSVGCWHSRSETTK